MPGRRSRIVEASPNFEFASSRLVHGHRNACILGALSIRRCLRLPRAVGMRARGDLRDDGRHQSRPWRVHHVRRLCDGIDGPRRSAASTWDHDGCYRRRAGRRAGRARGDPSPVRPAARHDRGDLGPQPDCHARHLDHGGIHYGRRRYTVRPLSGRRLFLFYLSPSAVLLRGRLGVLYMLFNWTRFGVLARATIQVPHMAAALGVDTRMVYSLTFACGAGLAGLAGGLYAPTMTLVPTMGATFIMEAFVTVVIGGADVFLGTAPAGGVRAVVKSAMTSWQGQLFGQIGLLVAVIIVVRVLPKGVSGFLLRERT